MVGGACSGCRSAALVSVELDAAVYPETMGVVLCINAPSYFTYIWSIVKVGLRRGAAAAAIDPHGRHSLQPWLDPATAAKVLRVGAG